MSFNWDEKSVLLLIYKFHDNEALWNRSHRDYRNRVRRAALFRSIAREVGTVRSEVERKLKNLSSHYYREKKSYERRIAALGSDAPEPRWFAYKALNFLQDKHFPRKRNLEIEAGNDEFQVSYTEVTSSNEDSEVSQCADDTRTKKLKSTPSTPVDTSRDEASVFGEYIALKIRRMAPVTAAMVQHRIQNIIYETDMASFAAAGLVPPVVAGKVSTSADSGAANDNDCSVPMPIKCEYGFFGDEPDPEQSVTDEN